MNSSKNLYFKMSDTKKIIICRQSLKNFKYSFIWPFENEELHAGKWYYMRVALFLVVTSMWPISIILHAVMAIRDNLDVHIIEDISVIAAVSCVYYMAIIYVVNQSKMALLLADISYFGGFGTPPGFREKNAKLNLLSKILHYYVYCAVIGYNILKLSKKSQCERTNELKNLNENCGFLTPTWFPFRTNYFPVFHLMFFYVLFSSISLLKLPLLISYNALEVAFHIVLRIERLESMILESLDSGDYESSRKKFKRCILYHLQILNFAARLNECFSSGMLAHLTITAVICGCLQKQFEDGDHKFEAMIHASGWVSALFTACIGGQLLINASASLPDTIWSSKWYAIDLRLRKDFLFMLLRSQKELHITAGPFGVISFALFVSVIKMSYSIFAMLAS